MTAGACLLAAHSASQCQHLRKVSPIREYTTLCEHAGTWSEDKAWTARMSEGWDNEGARRVMDDLITTYGNDK